MLSNHSNDTPWWAWVVVIAVILVSVLIIPDDVNYQERIVQLDH